MPKDSSAKYYPNNKENIKKELVKNIKVFQNTKLYQKIKNKSLLNVEKKYIKELKKMPY